MTDEQTQSEKFKEVARQLECDEDEARWNETVGRVAAQKLKPDQEVGESDR